MSRAAAVFLLTFTILTLELTLIRWVASQVRIVAYFPNLVLIAAFFGMGLGCLRQGVRSWFWLYPFGLLAMTLLVLLGSQVAFTAEGSSESFWLLYYNLPPDALVINNLYIPLLLTFVISVLIFIPLGQKLADLLSAYQEEGRTLWGYAYDLGGSLAGVIMFTALSWMETFPWVWFTVALLPGVYWMPYRTKAKCVYLVLVLGIVGIVQWSEKAYVYSPYYALSVSEGRDPDTKRLLTQGISTNGSLHQIMLGLEEQPSPTTDIAEVRRGFNWPFQYLEKAPSRALVLGAGTGNDLSILLQQGVESIDAVEIDPVIQRIGKERHPDQPYASERVSVHIDDARSFLNSAEEPYDLIVFGTLDSMTRLSALSNVRLDNFVYTRESLESARSLLAEKGGLILHFMVQEQHISDKITAMLVEVFGEFPVIRSRRNILFNQTFLIGPAFSHVQSELRAQKLALYREHVDASVFHLPRDDWPYLYLKSRSLGSFYWTMIGLVLVASLVLAWLIMPRQPSKLMPFGKVDGSMFLFGAAFLLLNTKAVTEIGLLWGNTWLTNSVTFASILFVLLVSTVFFAIRPLSIKVCFVSLFVSLVTLYFLPMSVLLGLPIGMKLIGTIAYVGIPFFFAGACFAGVFKSRVDVAQALGWNVIGALCGGLFEYTNILFGFKALYLAALAFYLLAFLLHQRQQVESVTSVSTPT